MKHSYSMTHKRITKQIQHRAPPPVAEHCRLQSFINCESGNKKILSVQYEQKWHLNKGRP